MGIVNAVQLTYRPRPCTPGMVHTVCHKPHNGRCLRRATHIDQCTGFFLSSRCICPTHSVVLRSMCSNKTHNVCHSRRRIRIDRYTGRHLLGRCIGPRHNSFLGGMPFHRNRNVRHSRRSTHIGFRRCGPSPGIDTFRRHSFVSLGTGFHKHHNAKSPFLSSHTALYSSALSQHRSGPIVHNSSDLFADRDICPNDNSLCPCRVGHIHHNGQGRSAGRGTVLQSNKRSLLWDNSPYHRPASLEATA